MNNSYHYMLIWLVEKLYGYKVFAKSQFFPTAKEYILFNYKVFENIEKVNPLSIPIKR